MATPPKVDDAFFMHYSSPYYDPRKAHEYYLRTRELKGRHSTKGFNKKQREAAAFVRSRVQAEKVSKTEAARAAKKSAIEKTRAQAQQLRTSLADRMRAFSEALTKRHSAAGKKITEDASEARQKIADKLKRDIAAVPEVPKNLPKAQRAKLQAERTEAIAKLRGQASKDREDLNADVAGDRQSERASNQQERQSATENASKERARVAGELRTAITKHLDAYKAARAKIQSESNATLDREFKNIRSKVR